MSTYSDFAKYVKRVRAKKKSARALTVGDSWFQYPLRSYGDLQSKIASHFGDDLLCFDDSYPGRDAKEAIGFVPRWARLASYLKDEVDLPFDLILISQGGNDVIGQDFKTHLKKADEAGDGTTWKWNSTIPEPVKRHIKLGALTDTFKNIRQSYTDAVEMRDDFAKGATIVTHTYADVTPVDKAYEFAGLSSGPWLWKPMRKVGLKDSDEQRLVARWLLESFHNLLLDVKKGTKRFEVLDTRKELPDYEGWWDNEIHPLGKGFKHLVDGHWVPALTPLV
jgi:hypothetical protein